MKRDIFQHSFPVLFAEDQETDRAVCVKRLKRKYPNARIDQAASCEEARHLIHAASNRDEPYLIAILDLQLPDKIGDVEEMQTSLGALIIEKFGHRATRLVQWTAYPEDVSIRRFQRENKIPQSGIVYEVISKRNVDWPQAMDQFINRAIVEDLFGRWLDHPYFEALRAEISSVLARQPPSARPPLDLLSFVRALIDVWPLLEPHRRLQAKSSFRDTEWELADTDDGVRLRDERLTHAMGDAQENARIFAEVMPSEEQSK